MNSVYGNYRTRKFNEIYPEFDKFQEDANLYFGVGLNPNFKHYSSIQTLYYLLSARYGNSNIANSDENQFRIRLFSIIFQFGPTWEKRLDIQSELRTLSDEELLAGTKQINNHSYNPSTAPSTDTLDELTTINEQTATKYKRAKMDAYSKLMELLEKDVTEEFMIKFKRLFLIIVEPQEDLWYITDIEGDNE